ncbi:hypothetical protein RI543_002220 [Arxiozyma heterogenica]|uniref:Ubiquitin carboxyl-terminal hydrolase n=1 Tax=Arxiozyma heterogenica TaxID=278026 RepID=A0AAN8A8P2_9SACH|nr:hypothetical protein RI543_002220 [Kazachstania heterogenica]
MDDIVSTLGDIPTVISKDECIYCFETCLNRLNDTPKTHSLNVCLKCFQTVCPRHVTLHRQAAFICQDSQHDTYLQIWKQEKELATQPSTQANKKLKLVVHEASKNDTFTTLWNVIKYDPMGTNEDEMGLYNVVLSSDDPNEKPSFINRILSAKSQTTMDQTHSWELTMNSCDHIRKFEPSLMNQTLQINILNEVQCEDCSLTQNLWLCLHCGNVGCGRKQVGIEGHSHALAHYEDNRTHSLAVKLGSLSATTNDVYCYSCDEDVRFPDNNQLHDILLNLYHIDLSNIDQAKEKTLTELQVEQNLKWDFRMTDSQGKDLILLPHGSKYGLGLQNLGNSCYMNSVLQLLFHDREWAQSLIKEYGGVEFPRDIMYPSTNLRCQWIKLYRAMVLEPEMYPNGIRPTTFKRCISQGNKEFESQRQQDAMEFFTFIMDRVKSVNKMTQFILVDKLKCIKCGKVKYTEQISNSIQVSLPEDPSVRDINLTEQLNHYFEANAEDIQFDCPSCKETVKGIKQLSLSSGPDLLVLNVMRMQIDRSNWTVKKTSDPIRYDSTIFLNSYVTKHDPNETILEEPEEEETDSTSEFIPRENVLLQLMEMGFSKDACRKALYYTGNLPDGEVAVQWLFEHIEDPDINDPLVIKNKNNNNSDHDSMYEEKAKEMTEMGFEYSICLKALKINKGDISSSIEWVFSHPDGVENSDIKSDTTEPIRKQKDEHCGHEGMNNVKYNLLDVVCHKGNSVQSGHYVEFHRDSIDQPWVLYNDEKMVQVDTEDEIQKNGYIYVYKRESM